MIQEMCQVMNSSTRERKKLQLSKWPIITTKSSQWYPKDNTTDNLRVKTPMQTAMYQEGIRGQADILMIKLGCISDTVLDQTKHYN